MDNRPVVALEFKNNALAEPRDLIERAVSELLDNRRDSAKDKRIL